jgi:HEPN domain-containing protein
MEGYCMKNKDLMAKWLERAKDNLSMAKVGKISNEIPHEVLCFNTQQAVEMALKAVHIGYNLNFPKTHDIKHLADLLQNENVNIPIEVIDAEILNRYAVETRYPGFYDPLTEEDYKEAVELAENVLKWAYEIYEQM